MGQFIFEYGIFLAKAVTVVVSVGAILILVVGFSRRSPAQFGLTVEKLNDKYREMTNVLQHAVMKKSAWKQYAKDEKKERKHEKKDGAKEDEQRKRLFVLDFKGDIRATAVKDLREEISAVVGSVDRPVNVVMGLQGVQLTLDELSSIGVKRVSVGSALSRAALGAFLRAAQEMRDHGTFMFAEEAVAYRAINDMFSP